MEKQKNRPSLRFPEFKDTWKKEKLENLVNSIDSGWSPQCEEYPSTENEWGVLKTTSVVWDGFNENENKKLPIKFEPRKNIEVQKNNILITRAGPTNRVGVAVHVDNVRSKLMLSDKIIRVITNNVNSSKFISILLSNSHAQKQLNRKSNGLATSQTNISQSILLNINLIHPSFEEQTKIANFLTSVDEKLQALKQKKSLLEQYKKGVMQKIFSQEIRFAADNGNDFEDWEEMLLKDLIEEKVEKTKVSNQYRILSSTAKGLFNQDEYFTRDIASKDNTGYKVLRINQLVFSPQNLWLGNINVNTKFEIGIVSPSYKIFSFNEKKTTAKFCSYFMLIPKMMFEYEQCSEQGASVVRRNLDMNLFLNIQFQIPCLEEQTKIANFLSAIDDKINQCQSQIEKTAVWKKGLLQQMFV